MQPVLPIMRFILIDIYESDWHYQNGCAELFENKAKTNKLLNKMYYCDIGHFAFCFQIVILFASI